MENCGTCKFWVRTTFYESVNVPDDGDCNEILKKITPDVRYGRDGGHIETIETEEDFYCSLHQKRGE